MACFLEIKMVDFMQLIIVAPGIVIAIAIVFKGATVFVARGKNKREAVINLSDKIRPPKAIKYDR